MSFVSDNEIEVELKKMKTTLEQLRQSQRIFALTFQNLPVKERVLQIRKIETDQKTIQAFIDKAKLIENNNSGLKFGLENLKQSYQALLTLWRKTEKAMETTTLAAGTHADAQDHATQATTEMDKALSSYSDLLRKLGHEVKDDHLKEFRQHLNSAYQQAKEKSGASDLNIDIVDDQGKIKVRMSPKKA